jgi:hypothetical protein
VLACATFCAIQLKESGQCDVCPLRVPLGAWFSAMSCRACARAAFSCLCLLMRRLRLFRACASGGGAPLPATSSRVCVCGIDCVA